MTGGRRAAAAVIAVLSLGGCGVQGGGVQGGATTRSESTAVPPAVARVTTARAPRAAAGPSAPAARNRTARATQLRARLLVSFRRVFGTDPLAMGIAVDTRGESVATLGYGGRNGLQVHRFRLPADQLRRLRCLVRHTRLRTTDVADVHYYIYWVTTSRGSYRLRQGLVPTRSRPLIAELNAITDRRTGW